MGNEFKDELIYNCAVEYQDLKDKKGRGNYLDFFSEKIVPIIYPKKVGDLNRKSIIRLLKRSLNKNPLPLKRSGRKKTYNEIDGQCLETMWPIMGYKCGNV